MRQNFNFQGAEEGSARSSDRELIQFLYIAIGSMAEVETQLILARELGFVKNIDKGETNVP